MHMNEVRAYARSHGLKTAQMKKADIIRSIQRSEGNFDCFGSFGNYCDRSDCLWRSDCEAESKKQ